MAMQISIQGITDAEDFTMLAILSADYLPNLGDTITFKDTPGKIRWGIVKDRWFDHTVLATPVVRLAVTFTN